MRETPFFRDLQETPVGSGMVLTWHPKVHADLPDLGVVVDLEVAAEDGRLVVTKFTAQRREGGGPITIDVLKSMPLVRLAALAASGPVLSGLVRVEEIAPGNYEVRPVTAEQLEQLPEVERVAVIYRAAYFLGLPPTAAVAEACGWSHDVAAKRVQAARRAGLLEPTTRGRKGA